MTSDSQKLPPAEFGGWRAIAGIADKSGTYADILAQYPRDDCMAQKVHYSNGNENGLTGNSGQAHLATKRQQIHLNGRTFMELSATSLIGDDVRNANGDDLGKVEDLMIDTDSGQVAYAVLSFGGFLGIGDKLFAVPLEAMQVDRANKSLVLNESKERLENAPGFDKDHWPSQPDAKWRTEVRSYYNLSTGTRA